MKGGELGLGENSGEDGECGGGGGSGKRGTGGLGGLILGPGETIKVTGGSVTR